MIAPDDESGIAAAIEGLIVAKQHGGVLHASATAPLTVAQQYATAAAWHAAFADILARCV